MRRGSRGLAWAILLSGCVAMANGLYIPVKALLAQYLLETAWDKRQAGDSHAPPWPWADTQPVARLEHTRLKISQIVLQGSSGRVLAFGPGHVDGTARPGTRGNVVVSGHRDTHFAWLADVRDDDLLSLHLPDGSVQRFRVGERFVTDEKDLTVLSPQVGQRLQLITCFPFDSIDPGGSGRYVVSAIPL